jgi:hypothetical protein
MPHVLHGYYGFDAIEVWISFGLLAAFAALYTAVHRRAGHFLQRCLEMVLITLVADFFIESLHVPMLAGMAWLTAGLFLKATAHRFLMVFGGAALLTSIASDLIDRQPWIGEVTDPAAKANAGASKGPAIVHIIFDEHIGLGGLPQSQEGQETARALQSAYLAKDFTTYSHAYSRYLHTINAVPDILNFGRRLGRTGNLGGGIVRSTDYLASLQEAGYDLTIYQSSFLDFCRGANEKRCVTYDRASLQAINEVSMATSDWLDVLMARYLGASDMLNFAFEFFRGGNIRNWEEERLQPQGFQTLREIWSLAGLRAMDHFVDDLKQARTGNAYLIHALMPHYPYLTARDCAVKPVAQWRRRQESRSLAEREGAYYDQLHCAARLVDRAVAALRESPAGSNAIIIVHGDHGSRIVNQDPVEERRGKITKDEMISSFSTLFAVRLPGQQPRNHTGFVSAPAILEGLVRNEFAASPDLPPEVRPTVVLDDSAWRPIGPMDLPTDW